MSAGAFTLSSFVYFNLRTSALLTYSTHSATSCHLGRHYRFAQHTIPHSFFLVRYSYAKSFNQQSRHSPTIRMRRNTSVKSPPIPASRPSLSGRRGTKPPVITLCPFTHFTTHTNYSRHTSAKYRQSFSTFSQRPSPRHHARSFKGSRPCQQTTIFGRHRSKTQSASPTALLHRTVLKACTRGRQLNP